LGGFGISDTHRSIFNVATARGCKIVQETVNDINCTIPSLSTNLNSYKSSVVLGALVKDQI
jgi:hypothetical protein